jgi:hypothetical protein
VLPYGWTVVRSKASDLKIHNRLRSEDDDNESELIAAILGGTQLYHQLIRPYERRVYFMSLSYLKSKEDAEDIAQETFISKSAGLPWRFEVQHVDYQHRNERG